MLELDKLHNIALKVRTKFEKSYGNDLCGYCAEGSAELFDKLKKRGYNVDIAVNEKQNHVFCLVDDNIIVDVTSCQFGLEKITIDNKNDLEEKYYNIYKIGHTYKSKNDFKIYQLTAYWPAEQIIKEE